MEELFWRGYFNPRSHKGSDTILSSRYRLYRISIHAPTRGATVLSSGVICRIVFQSTLPQGERRIRVGCLSVVQMHFNPRSHKGSDRPRNIFKISSLISIHAPTRGATIQHPLAFSHPLQFQSTLPQGERQ